MGSFRLKLATQTGEKVAVDAEAAGVPVTKIDVKS